MKEKIGVFFLIVTLAGLFFTLSLSNCQKVSTPTIVSNGKIKAVVVVADPPSRTATYAAEELVRHVEKATGQRLAIVAETNIPNGYASRIFVGVTRAAREQGLEPEKLGPDEFILRAAGPDLYILGNEKQTMDPLHGIRYSNAVLPEECVNPYSGTLFGVYEILSRYVGVRWLWPGELGTYVPRTKRLVIQDALNETGGPRLKFRLFSWYHISLAEKYESRYASGIRELAFTPAGILKYRDDLEVYLRRHRLGDSEVTPHSDHTFHWWWQRFGKAHPEWFMLKADGQRGPEPGQTISAMCVSNPDLHRYIVEHYRAGDLYVTGWAPPNRIAHAGYIPLADTDSRSCCHCAQCKAWDGPQPTNYPDFVKKDYEPLLSNRYARFWKTIYEMAAEKDPQVRITTFLYWYYFPAPTVDIKLNKNIYGEFTPWTGPAAYYPMPEEADQWLREQWLGWKKTGMTLVYRPNYFHCGYVMPHLSTRQAGEFFKWAYQNGMVATSYDSLYGHWATRGPMIYMLMRLFWNPELEIDDIRREYFSGFGPAAGLVEKYFDYWEQYSSSATRGKRWLHGDEDRAYVAFPPAVFHPAEELLKTALKAAETDPLPEFAERVKFLQAGLDHAKLAAEFMASLDPVGPWGGSKAPVADPKRFEKSKQLLKKLIEFRRTHERLYISDYLDAAMRENQAVKNIDILLKDIP